MKRPFACIGLSMLFSLVFAIEFYTAVPYVIAVCFALSAIFFALKFLSKKKTFAQAVCCLSACIAMLSYCGIVERYINPLIEEYDGQFVEFSATITSKPYTSGNNTYFTVRTNNINGEKKNVNIQIITSYPLPMDIYDTVRGSTELFSDYESGYGYASYYAARGIFLKAYINPYYDSSYKVVHNNYRPFYAVLSDLRDTIANTFKRYLSYDEASLCTAVITGEKSYLSDNIYANFKNLGVSHILVVSGLHLSIVCVALGKLATKATKNVFHQAAVQIMGVVAFAALTGFGFSVIRALVLAIIMIIARTTRIKPDPLNSLGFAALILCLNPLNVGDIGMLWSFSCTLSLILFSTVINDFLTSKFKIFKFISKRSISLVSTSLAAFIGSLPFLIFVTGSLSPYTIIVNILTVPFTGIIILFGGLSVIFFSLNINIVAYPLIYISGVTSKYLIFITDKFASFPMATISTDKSYVYIWFLLSLATVSLLFIINKKHYISISGLAMASILIALYSIDIIFNSDKITLSVLDVGNGATITVACNDEIVLLNSYGEKYQYSAIQSELSEYNCISCIVDIPPNETDYNYCRKITHDFDVKEVFLHDDKMFEETYCYHKTQGVKVTKIDDNHTIYFFENAELNIITESKTTWEYLNIYGTEILICQPNSDFTDLPSEFENPDIIVINDIPENFNLADNTYVIVSNYGEDYDYIMNYLNDKELPVIATNGLGKVNIEFSSNGSIVYNREYTGGVTRYEDER